MDDLDNRPPMRRKCPALHRWQPPLGSTAAATKVDQDGSPPPQGELPLPEELVPLPTFMGLQITDDPTVVHAYVTASATTTQRGDSSTRPPLDWFSYADAANIFD